MRKPAAAMTALKQLDVVMTALTPGPAFRLSGQQRPVVQERRPWLSAGAPWFIRPFDCTSAGCAQGKRAGSGLPFGVKVKREFRKVKSKGLP
jgi:hypothetical protein